MGWQIGSVWLGVLLAAAGLWTVRPWLVAVPAVGLVVFGLLLDDGKDAA